MLYPRTIYVLIILNDGYKLIIQEAVEEHQKVFDPDNPRDLIDEYLIDLKNKKSENEKFLRIGGQ